MIPLDTERYILYLFVCLYMYICVICISEDVLQLLVFTVYVPC